MAKILWIEDEADKINGLVRPLVKDGHEIVIAKDKKEALIEFANRKFDLIILDIIIPEGVDNFGGSELEPYVGITLLYQLKGRNVPIIVLTVINDGEVLKEVSDCGVERILQKGYFLPSTLKEEVYNVLGLH